MVKLKPITDTSWLVTRDNDVDKVGILSDTGNGFMLMSKNSKELFPNKDAIIDHFKENVFNNIIERTDTNKKYFIKGYPVDFYNPFEVNEREVIDDLPLYTKTAISKVMHCAGYYCISFTNGWLPTLCPKLSTLQKYGYKGPFKTEMEMKSHLNILRRASKED